MKLSVGKPELINAGTNAVAPGNDSTAILFSRHALTITCPGSEIAGVPESEIKQLFSTD